MVTEEIFNEKLHFLRNGSCNPSTGTGLQQNYHGQFNFRDSSVSPSFSFSFLFYQTTLSD